jgi:hypothetical protein
VRWTAAVLANRQCLDKASSHQRYRLQLDLSSIPQLIQAHGLRGS